MADRQRATIREEDKVRLDVAFKRREDYLALAIQLEINARTAYTIYSSINSWCGFRVRKMDDEIATMNKIMTSHHEQMIQLVMVSKVALSNIQPEMGVNWFRHLQSACVFFCVTFSMQNLKLKLSEYCFLIFLKALLVTILR